MNVAPRPAGTEPALPLGAILAGGLSRRYGAPKALARVGGVRLVDRVRAALERAIPDPVAIANDAALAAAIGLPHRADLLPGGGAIAGIHAALSWAAERGRRGALVVACDMPFVPPGLLARLVAEAEAGGAEAVVPEGPSRHGVEPLCAWYALAALPAVERRARRGARSLGELVAALDARRVPAAEVARHGDPATLFANVNTPDERARAERTALAPEDTRAEH